MVDTPTASTQGSACSPPPIAPAPSPATKLAPNPNAPLRPAMQGLPTPRIFSSKEWIIPPRPKPGRKPATDTPPTKRKAQNRAAQRAFRERRAARVGELEEHIKKIEEEDEQEQTELRQQIMTLEADVNRFKEEILAWQDKAEGLERSLDQEKAENKRAQQEIALLRRGQTASTTEAVPLPPRKSPRKQRSSSQQQSLIEQTPRSPEDAGVIVGCGNCSHDTRCECIEQAINTSKLTYLEDASSTGPQTAKRSRSPLHESNTSKRSRNTQDDVKPDLADLEIDMTSRYTSKPSLSMSSPFHLRASSPTAIMSPATVQDPCGFCQDGTPCVCAELESQQNAASADSASMEESSSHFEDNRLPPILSQFTPPPSDGDVPPHNPSSPMPNSTSNNSKPRPVHPSLHHSASSLGPPMRKSSNLNPCANGPGTCAQCRADPHSTLFCKSLAALKGVAPSASSSPASSGGGGGGGGCCGGAAANGGGCCRAPPPQPSQQIPSQSQSQSQLQSQPRQQQQQVQQHAHHHTTGPTLSCADAYTTLSRHPHYAEASDELGSWLGRLATSPPRGGGVNDEERAMGDRPAMEVEAASVMGVLKLFDRRFGRE
ncbi:MAG: hypothetical protein M1819_006028 [Sarea resinae]|nr:MAG: hypothetical protein M1819_006028 [Sarea resinae]